MDMIADKVKKLYINWFLLQYFLQGMSVVFQVALALLKVYWIYLFVRHS